MADSFACFFEKYKKLLREYSCNKKSAIDQPRKWTVIIVAGIIMGLCLALLFFRMNDVLCVCLSLGLMICCVILFANINPYPATGPDEQPYLDHIRSVLELLKEHGIDSDNTDRIIAMIEFANNMIARRDPLVDIKRAIVITGSAGAVITTVLSGALTGTINLVDSIPYVIVILIMVFASVMLFSPISSCFTRLIFPDKSKYQKLIDDLNQIMIFDMSNTIQKRCIEKIEHSSASDGEDKQIAQ